MSMVQQFSHTCDVATHSEGEEVSTTEEMTMPLAKRRGLHIVDFENDEEDAFQGSNFLSNKSMTSILTVRTRKMPRLSSSSPPPSQILHQDIEKHEAVTLSSGSSEDGDEDCCSTPRECRIPEPLVCPPAPKKPRAAPSKNKRIVPNFFVNPDDLESLFNVGISKPLTFPSSCKELALLW